MPVPSNATIIFSNIAISRQEPRPCDGESRDSDSTGHGAKKSCYDQHVTRRVLHDALGDGAEERTGNEVPSPPTHDQEVGGHLACHLDQDHSRIALRRPDLDAPILSSVEQASRFLAQALAIERATGDARRESRRAQVGRDRNQQHALRVLYQVANASQTSPSRIGAVVTDDNREPLATAHATPILPPARGPNGR
jgi:hypothetical protein